MRITKFVHSCVLVEDDDVAVLFDPGIFSWNSGLVEVSKLPELTVVVVTHKHGDHMAEPFVRALAERFAEIQWVVPSDAHAQLAEWGITKVTNRSTGKLEVTEVDHAPVEPFGVQVKNLTVHWNGTLTHPGDTHEITESKEILMLPVQAPWGTTVRAFEIGQELKPKYLIPIHDWMWNDEWRNHVYDRLEQVFADSPTKFLRPMDGQAIEVEL